VQIGAGLRAQVPAMVTLCGSVRRRRAWVSACAGRPDQSAGWDMG